MIGIEGVMSQKVHTLGEENSLKDAQQLMLEKDIRHIPIVNDKYEIIGLVSHRDVLTASESSLSSSSAEERSAREQKITLASIMKMDVATVDSRDSLLSVALHLKKYRHGCMPVVNGKKLVGIVSSSDFLDLAIQSIEMEEQRSEMFDEEYEAQSL